MANITDNTRLRLTDLNSSTSYKIRKVADIRMETAKLTINLTLSKTQIKPKKLGRKPSGASDTPNETEVKLTTSPAISGMNVKFSSKEIENSGGHNHIGRPTHFNIPVSGVTNSSGEFKKTYKSGEASGKEKIIANMNGFCIEKILDIRVDWITDNLIDNVTFLQRELDA